MRPGGDRVKRSSAGGIARAQETHRRRSAQVIGAGASGAGARAAISLIAESTEAMPPVPAGTGGTGPGARAAPVASRRGQGSADAAGFPE